MTETPWLANFFWKIGLKNSKPDLLDKTDRDKIRKRIHVEYDIYAEVYPPEKPFDWEVTKALILRISEELKKNKIGFLVVIIPNELEFRPDIWRKTLDENPHMKNVKFDLRKPERILSNCLRANNIDYMLLRPEFEQYSRETGKDLHSHFACDNHWNANGHALVAQLIYRRLKGDKLVPVGRDND